MLLFVVVTFSICCSSAFAEKNFWNNDICTTDNDCSGLTSCHPTFGCNLSGVKVGLVMLSVFLVLCAIITAVACLCRRNLRDIRFSRPHNHYLPQTVMTTNPTPWNQHQMATTTTVYQPSYPHNPYPNQFYANSVNQPMYNQHQMDPRLGATINVSQNVPNAPYPPAGFDYGHRYAPQTH